MLETLTTDVNPQKLLVSQNELLQIFDKVKTYIDLTKPRITFEVVLITLFGFLLGTSTPQYPLLLHTLVAVALLSSGISTLNQYIERDLDKLMRRTVLRPLPAGKIAPKSALFFGITLTILAEIYFVIAVNQQAAWLGLATFISYVCFYTPLKTKSSWSTFIGSFPGAMPPLVGWVSATGDINIKALSLFAIMFFWQFPHFLAIAWMYREDYARAGIKMLPVIETNYKRTKQQILLNTFIMLILSFLPIVLGISSIIYGCTAALLGIWFLKSVLSLHRNGSPQDARHVLKTSIAYISLLYIFMVIDKV